MRWPALILALVIFLEGAAFAWPFSKKYNKEQEEKQHMVQTVDEWMESAASPKMDMRTRGEDSSQKDERLIPPADKPLYISKYNVKAGSKELDLTRLSKTKNVRSVFVADPKFEKAVYSEVYFYPQTEQTAATMYMIELDEHLEKRERLADVSIFEHTRYPLISTALPYLREGFFSTLTLVDFSSDGKKIIVKEKRGSNRYGLYETYVWLYFFTDEPRGSSQCYKNNIGFSNELSTYNALNKGLITPSAADGGNGGQTRGYNQAPPDFHEDSNDETGKQNPGFGVCLNLLNEMIKAYWFDRQELILNYIRWDLKPLGFNKNNKDEVVVIAWGYGLSGEEVSLGRWGVNINDGLPRLIPDNEEIQIEANGLFLEAKLNP